MYEYYCDADFQKTLMEARKERNAAVRSLWQRLIASLRPTGGAVAER